MGIIRSKKRSPKPISIHLDQDMILTATGTVNINIPFLVNHVDFFPSSFKLEAGKQILYVDPLVVDDEIPADFIFITHAHSDHFSMPDIEKLMKRETTIICPIKVYKKLSKVLSDCRVIKVKPGEKWNFDEVSVQVIEAYNLKSGLVTPHSKSSMNVSYIIDIGGIKFYHAGDSDYVPEMNGIKNIDVVLTPIDGGNLTMSTEKAAELTNKIKPKWVIPMHYNIGTNEIEKFRRLINDHIQVQIMDGYMVQE
ncbi:MAG: MBL fold metallo-hydrolase [Clostridia bacterium]|nr:MBL fold metallo-hydrolase [Clostridia bacterium]